MKNLKFRLALMSICLFLIKFSAWSQCPKSLITVSEDFIMGMDNDFYVVASQNKPITKDQIQATLKLSSGIIVPLEIQGDNGYFTVHPDSLGLIEFYIQLKDTLESKRFRVKPIPLIVALSNFGAKEEIKITPGEFKAQRGLYAYVNCCGFDSRCEIVSFEVIRITSLNKVERSMNMGGVFQPSTKNIIDRTTSGDLYVFRNIYSKCFEGMKSQRVEDMTFEIK